MDRAQLVVKLKSFKQACVETGCINENNENALDLEEVYPGAIPTSFIINVHVKKKWLDDRYNVNALKELIKLLYEKVDTEALENILTLRICEEDDVYFYDTLPPKEAV